MDLRNAWDSVHQVSDCENGIQLVGATAQQSLQDGFEALLPFSGGEGVGTHDRHQVRSDRQQRPESGHLVQTADVSLAVREELADTATGRPTGSGRLVDLSAAAVTHLERAVFRRRSI